MAEVEAPESELLSVKPTSALLSPDKDEDITDVTEAAETETDITIKIAAKEDILEKDMSPEPETVPDSADDTKSVKCDTVEDNDITEIYIKKDEDLFENGGSVATKRKISTTSSASSSASCCNSSCVTKVGLSKAPSYAASFYGNLPKKKSLMICKTCLEKPEEFMKISEYALLSQTPLFNIGIEPRNTTAMIDLDDDSEEEKSSDDEMYEVPQDLDNFIKDFAKEVQLQKQFKSCLSIVNNNADELDSSLKGIEKEMNAIEEELERAKFYYSEYTGPKYRMVVTNIVDIDRNGVVKDVTSRETKNARKMQELSQNSSSDDPPILQRQDYDMVDREGEIKVLEKDTESCMPQKKSKLTATPSIIPRKSVQVGDEVYGQKNSSLSFWHLGKVIEVVTTLSHNIEYKVTFERQAKGKGNKEVGPYVVKQLIAKHLAYNRPCPFQLPVGTRIIALFKDEFGTAESANKKFYAGIVAEPPKNTNSFRYLVFFDDGYAQYVAEDQVLLVCETSKDVWMDVHPESQDFIKNYLHKYPERPMVRLTVGEMVTTEWNGKWFIARVNEVDCSLVKMFFEGDGRYEWVYRGSTRLAPLYQMHRRQQTQDENVTINKKRRRHYNGQQSRSTIEYLYGHEEAPPPDITPKLNNRPGTFVAKKSTAKQQEKEPPVQVQRTNQVHAVQQIATTQKYQKRSYSSVSLAEYEGKMLRKPFPSSIPSVKTFVPHNCGKSCIPPYDPDDKELLKVGPLNVPNYLGFCREMVKSPRRAIYYRGPCGKRFRDINELQDYLSYCNSNISIDFFCFDFNVDCLGEFKPTRQFYFIKDLSYGKECIPVSCINSLDFDYPEYVEYTQARLPSSDVRLELDPAFLSCCDCTDDCSDKSKCHCWQLTIENTKILNGTVSPDVGYKNRRLYDHVITGIYECNQNCRCKKTCSNRVAQNKLRWPLQVFKTSAKGWAIRPLHDIPEGAFICVYAGQLLTEQGANEDGVAFGDEYLAELDYIEINESAKEGYEAEVVNLDDEDEEDPNKGKESKDPKSDEDDVDGERTPSRFSAQVKNSNKANAVKSTRDLFGEDEDCYIMDAKSVGNIGRYLNHSCTPNVFVQNVFVDTHDLRFPWVSFFASKHIRAGTELTWDYNYDIGSVPGKTMYCFCGSVGCRGRLL